MGFQQHLQRERATSTQYIFCLLIIKVSMSWALLDDKNNIKSYPIVLPLSRNRVGQWGCRSPRAGAPWTRAAWQSKLTVAAAEKTSEFASVHPENEAQTKTADKKLPKPFCFVSVSMQYPFVQGRTGNCNANSPVRFTNISQHTPAPPHC